MKNKYRYFGLAIFSIILLAVSSCQSEQANSKSDAVAIEHQANALIDDEQLSNQVRGDSPTNIESQPKLSDEKLKELSDLNKEMRAIRNQLSEKLTKFIADQGYSIDDYQQLLDKSKSDLSVEDEEVIRKIDEQMTEFQFEVSSEMERIVTESGYTMEEFMQLGRIISRDPEMRAKIER